MPIIGLTGPPGAGKSTVARQFHRLSCEVLDADSINHELLTQPYIIQEVTNLWGPEVLDRQGRIDREALGRIVFNNQSELAKLTNLLHPSITRQLATGLQGAQVPAKAVVMDVPLLFELGLDDWCDAVVLVDAPAPIRYQRLKQRHGWDDNRVRQVESLQQPLENKRLRADYIINNDAAEADLAHRVEAILKDILARAPHARPDGGN